MRNVRLSFLFRIHDVLLNRHLILFLLSLAVVGVAQDVTETAKHDR